MFSEATFFVLFDLAQLPLCAPQEPITGLEQAPASALNAKPIRSADGGSVMNVIPFPRKPTFTLLNGCSDGWFVLHTDELGRACGAIGPFSDVAAAHAWAVENGAREGVKLDSSFPGGGAA